MAVEYALLPQSANTIIQPPMPERRFPPRGWTPEDRRRSYSPKTSPLVAPRPRGCRATEKR